MNVSTFYYFQNKRVQRHTICYMTLPLPTFKINALHIIYNIRKLSIHFMESIRSNVSPQRPDDLPATFESLNDDTLGLILKFVGNKSYRSFGGLNKHCKEVYLSSGMTKETYLYGYATLSAITNKIEGRGTKYYDWESLKAVCNGIIYYNRSDLLDWALEEREKDLSYSICYVAGREGRIGILEEVWNNIEDEDDKRYVFGSVDSYAAHHGKLKVLKWVEEKGLSIDKKSCAKKAANRGHLHILQWLKEEQGLELDGVLYFHAICGGQLHVMKWLKEQEVDWSDDTFHYAAKEGNLAILQWLHDEGCPWPVYSYRLCGDKLKPEVVDWCRANGYYGNRVV